MEDETALVGLQERLQNHGVEVTRVVDHQFIQSIYFTDNNGIALEASYWVKDATETEPNLGDAFLFSDPDPVVALQEQLATT